MKGKIIECYKKKEIKWNINDIYILSSSFGSSIVLSTLHKLETKNCICICPLTDLSKHNSDDKLPEENLFKTYDFLNCSFSNAFRNLEKDDWITFIKGKSNANPINYTSKIKNKNIFLAHGKTDKVVNYNRTIDFYNEIKNNNEVTLKIYDEIGHGSQIKKKSIKDILQWIDEN